MGKATVGGGATNKGTATGDAGRAKPIVTGSRGGNAALANLLAALAQQGIITDQTT
jgi:hypothetical protein